MDKGISFERGPRDQPDSEKVVWQLKEYNGHRFVDARLFFRGEDGKPHPTRKGTTIRAHEIGPLIRWLTEARDELQRAEENGRDEDGAF